MSAPEEKGKLNEDEITITFSYSSAQIAKLASKLWLQAAARDYLVWIVLAALLLPISASSGYASKIIREEDVARGFLWGAGALAAFQLVKSYVVYLREWSRWGGEKVTYRFGADEVHLHSQVASDNWTWESFSAVWKRPDLWIFYDSHGAAIILPTANLPDELKHLISSKIEEVEGDI